MGSLRRFNFSRIIKRFGIEYFFETGTWKGDGVAFASKFPFKKIYSSEIVTQFSNKASQRFINDVRVEIINKNSNDALLEKLEIMDGNCIFWLDAHYPSADEGLADYNDEVDENIRLPLAKEIEILARRKSLFKDVILIDDLRIYEDGPFTYGNISEKIISPEIRNIDFVYAAFSDTHTINKSYKDEGYLYLFPKHVNPPNLISRLYDFIGNVLGKRII